jgi:farnesyl diphosphate synthase
MNQQALFEAWADDVRAQLESALDQWVPAHAPAGLGDAMRYAVLDGGKRLRALLVFATAQACGNVDDAATHDAALRAAVAVELIHAYSLVHDDLPCMDNDTMRRGKPTVHVQFGEAQAMLAGDAMQALAFEVLTPDLSWPELGEQAIMQARMCRILSRASGEAGMAGGQAIDLASVGHPITATTLQDMHHRKTGALLNASVLMGAASVGVRDAAPIWQALNTYGESLGLAFQIVDDILDVTVSSDALGKTAGKDAAANKPTYVSLLGLAQAQSQANALHAKAMSSLSQVQWPTPAVPLSLQWLADYVVQREH